MSTPLFFSTSETSLDIPVATPLLPLPDAVANAPPEAEALLLDDEKRAAAETTVFLTTTIFFTEGFEGSIASPLVAESLEEPLDAAEFFTVTEFEL